jgi:hypothetical protein
MKIYLAAIIFMFFLIFIGHAFAAITIRSGSCLAGETCLFSAWNLSNSHVGQCGYYTNYSVCSDEVSSAAIRNACLSNEGILLSFFQPNNTHVGKFDVYSYFLCAPPRNYSCGVRISCLSGQSCLGSLYNKTNSHFAECNFYSYQICCGFDTTPPTISNESINATSILPGQAVRFTANVTDNFEVSKVIVTVQYPNGTLKNYTISLLSGDIYFLDFTDTLDNGIYIWKTTYANDSVNNFSTSSPNLQFRVLGITYTIKGIALDSSTGEKILSGTATAIIKETGDRNSGTITDGSYTINLRTHLNTSINKFTVGIILNSTDGRIGYNYMTMGYGPFAEQTQTCSVNQWHFKGKAIDSSTGTVIDQGTVQVTVVNEAAKVYTNTTTFSAGSWDIYISPCLISGGLYTFQFTISSGEKTINMFINQVAK